MTIADTSPPVTPPPPSVPPASLPGSDDATSHLQHRLASRWDDFLGALASRDFYFEAVLVLLAIVVAGIVTQYVTRKIKSRIATSPPKLIGPEFILRPLLLLGPTLVIVFLWIAQGLATGVGFGGGLTAGIVELAYAYWLTKCVVLVIRVRPVAYMVSAAILINAVLRAARVNRSTSNFLESISFDVGQYHLTALHLVHGLVVFVVVFWGAGLLTSAMESYLIRGTSLNPHSRSLAAKFFRILVYVIAFATTLSAVGIDLTAFAIFSGALGVGIGLGLQKITSNFVSGVTVLMEKSIKIGDLIEVGGYSGWVRQLNTRYALLETSDGREVLIPNEELISSRVINWTLTTTLARIEINVTTDFASDAEKARDLLIEAALEHPRCLKDPKPTCWLREFTDHGLHFVLSFWIADIKEGRNGPQSDVMFEILKKFKANEIQFVKI